ncbi:MAG: AraC family transcriptional regulator [Thermoanaerobaculia bacterium]|nr:AraC family transcriptional regulator [Thermoanaerobaculia bacterium]
MPIESYLLAFRRQFGDVLFSFFRNFFKPSLPVPAPMVTPADREPEYLRHLRFIVEIHLDEAGFRVDALCHECHASQPQLYRKLTALSGLSPGRFIRFIRLQKARELLRQPGRTIAEIAFETGFGSPAHFTRLFVKMFGMTPSAYRKSGG